MINCPNVTDAASVVRNVKSVATFWITF